MAMQSTTKRSLSRRWEDYQPSKTMLVWTCIAAIVATMVVGFSWGGWVTGGTSQAMAATAGDTKWVRPPLPCRPSKFRFDVDAQRCPGDS